MSTKKNLMNRIRGWFPTESALLTCNSNIKKSNIKIPKGPPSMRERVVGGLGAAGGGLVGLGIIFYFVPMYPKQAVAILLIVGIPLLAAAIIVSRTTKNKSQINRS
jgi:hypothetical protein